MLLWALLFCGGAVLPSCSGILVSVVPNQFRAVSSSVSIMIFNLFGYFLSLTLSGYLMQFILVFRSDCDYICARVESFRLIMVWSIFSLLFLAFALETASGYFGTCFLNFCSRIGWAIPAYQSPDAQHTELPSTRDIESLT